MHQQNHVVLSKLNKANTLKVINKKRLINFLLKFYLMHKLNYNFNFFQETNLFLDLTINEKDKKKKRIQIEKSSFGVFNLLFFFI